VGTNNALSDMNKNTVSIFVILRYLWCWRKMICIVTGCFIVLGVLIALLSPEEFQATTVILPPPSSEKGLSSIAGVSDLPLNLSPSMFGLNLSDNSGTARYIHILSSNRLRIAVIDSFKLAQVYGFTRHKKYFIEDVLKAFDKHVNIGSKKDEIVLISVTDTSRIRAAAIANFMAKMVDSINQDISHTHLGKKKDFLEQRMLENRLCLKKGEDSLLGFQKSKGIVAVQQQAEATVQALSGIETNLLQQEMQLTVAKLNFQGNSPQIQEKLNGIIAMRSQLAKMGTEKSTSIFLPVSQIPDDALVFSRLKRSILIMDVLDQYLTKEYETAKLDEKSTVPTIAVLDSATVPEKRIKPKRKKMVLIMTFIGAAVGIAGSYMLFSLSQYKDVLPRNWCFNVALKLANKVGVSRVV
jgi:tyrosine-protein kinase Etk/Wzc